MHMRSLKRTTTGMDPVVGANAQSGVGMISPRQARPRAYLARMGFAGLTI